LIKSKIAQLRVYPTALNEEQLLHIQARSFWNLEKQDPAANQLTSRGPQNATFAQATAACAAQGRSMVVASSRESIHDLRERASTDLQSISWVGASKDDGTSKWKWPNHCLLAETDFFTDFTCHLHPEGVPLADAAQQCLNEGRNLKVPRNDQYATLESIKVSCPEMPSFSRASQAVLAKEDACVIAGGSCLSQRRILRMDMAMDRNIKCPEGLESRIAPGRFRDLYVTVFCCRPSPACSPPSDLYFNTSCEGRGIDHSEETNTCLAVLKFQGELRYVARNCSERLSYVCQEAPVISSAPTVTADSDYVGDMKECYDESDLESGSFADTTQQDVQGNTCSWYAARQSSHPQVCSSSAAKQMCPVHILLLIATYV